MINIALVSHDGRKKELLEWVEYNAIKLTKYNLYATGTTGKLISEKFHDLACNILEHAEYSNLDEIEQNEVNALFAASKNVQCLLSGPLGGDAQIGAKIAEGKIDALIFFCDNLIVQGHNSDIQGLSRLASLYNIAFATNRTTADMILTSPLFDDDSYKRIMPSCIENYKNRNIK